MCWTARASLGQCLTASPQTRRILAWIRADTKAPEKYNLSGLACVATAALIDWSFTTTLPVRITADTAIDSLTHAIEAYVSRKAFPYTDGFALQAMPLIAKNVRRAYADPEDGAAVTEFSITHAAPRYATCARVMGVAEDTDTDDTACAKLVEALSQLNADLEVPTLSQLGHEASPQMLALMANQALTSGSPQNNPRIPTEAEIVKLYTQIW